MQEHTPVLSLTWQIAAIEAADAHHEFIEPEHFFIGLCKLEGFANVTRLRTLGVPESEVAKVEAEIDLLMGLFERFKIGATTFRHELRHVKGRGSYSPANPNDEWVMHRSPQSKRAFERAAELARQFDAPVVAAPHLLAGLLNNRRHPLVTWLAGKGINIAGLQEAAEATVLPFLQPAAEPGSQTAPLHTATDLLGQYSRNLTLLAHRSQITPTGSFEDEQMELIRVLNRPAANNPLLLTETKTQGQEVVHDLAWQFIHGVVPPALGKRRILELNLDQLSTNINYQGHFAHRVQEVLKEVMEEPDVILFIARIETLIGSGSIHVDMADVSQLMADALERGKIQCIGATTSKEYKAYISLKEELNRHFQPIVLGEHPPAADAPPEAPPVQPVKASEPLNWSPGAKQPETGAGVRSALGRVEKRLGRFGLQLQVSPAALAFLARQPGGRQRTTPAIEAAISQHIENPLGAMLLRGEVDHGQTIAVDVAGNQLVIKVAGK